MNQERRCIKPGDSPRRSSQQSSDFPAEPWHSTPVKKPFVTRELQDVRPEALASGRDRMVRQEGSPLQSRLLHSTSLPLTQDSQMTVCDLENSTILRQRRELQLLMAELKDRDQELNNMAAAHHTQLLAWQQDRQRVLLLEERCVRLEEELQQQHELLRVVGRRAQAAEAQDESIQRELNATQQQLQDLRSTQRHGSQLQRELEDRNQTLTSTITLLSSQVGQLQAREEELTAMLKLKDKDMTEAITHIEDLSGRLRTLEDTQRELRTRESKALAELEGVKRRYRDVRHENTRLKDELQEKTLENSTQREEVIRLKQEAQLLRRDLLISGEGESWKDEMLELSRSKQERTEAELRCLRQMCENQQNDLELLKLNLESAQEALKQQKVQLLYDSGMDSTAVESVMQRTVAGTEAGHTYYQHRAVESSEELTRGGGAPALESERQEAVQHAGDSPASSQALLNGVSLERFQAGVSTSAPIGDVSIEQSDPGSLTTQPVDTDVLSQPTAFINMSQPIATLSTVQSTAGSSTGQVVSTSTTRQTSATISTISAADASSMRHSIAKLPTGLPVATSYTSQPIPSVAPDQLIATSPTAQPVDTISTDQPVATIPTVQPVTASSTSQPVTTFSTDQPVNTVSTCQHVATISTSQPVSAVSMFQSVPTTSSGQPKARVPIAQSVAPSSTKQPIANVPIGQAIGALSSGQPVGQVSSRDVSSSCPPEPQPSCSSTPAFAHGQPPVSRHSETTQQGGNVYSVPEGVLPRSTPEACEVGGDEQPKDEPGVGGSVATDRCEAERATPEKQEDLEVEVAVMLEVGSESEYSVQMLEVDPLSLDSETEQVLWSCQGEVMCSPQPDNPLLWTSVNTGGSPRAIYLASPTSPRHSYQEVNCSSTQRLRRLLKESQDMVATLEGLSLESKSPSPHSTHSHTPSPSHKSSHSPVLNQNSVRTLNGFYDCSSSQHSGSEIPLQNSASHSSRQTKKNGPSRPVGDTSQ